MRPCGAAGFFVGSVFRVCLEPRQGVFYQDAAAWERAAPFFHSRDIGNAYAKGGGKLGLVEQARGAVRQVAEFFFFL